MLSLDYAVIIQFKSHILMNYSAKASFSLQVIFITSKNIFFKFEL